MGYSPKLVEGKVKDTGYPIDGLVLLFSLWDYDNYEHYHLSGWRKDYDEAVMQTIYQSEEEAGLCLYDSMEEFAEAWKSEAYEPECSFCLPRDKVKELKVVEEETK